MYDDISDTPDQVGQEGDGQDQDQCTGEHQPGPTLTAAVMQLPGAGNGQHPAQHQPETEDNRQNDERDEWIIKKIDPDKQVDKSAKQG